jgi:hypothetical protein
MIIRAAASEIEAGTIEREVAPALVIRQLVDGARKR